MALALSFLTIVVLSLVTADNTTDYINKLEQKISDLESHFRASEQKQAAVLASVLSQLQAQGEKIQENTDDLQNRSSVATTGSQHVAFEARTTSDRSSALIIFDSVPFNIGSGYDASTGTFTAPITGIYQFWFTVYVSGDTYGAQPNRDPTHLDVVNLIAGNAGACPSYGGYVAAAQVVSNRQHHDVRDVKGQHVLHLTVGETVYVNLSPSGPIKAGSSFGGVLIG